MSILHNQSKTIAIQNATNFTLFDIAIDSIVDAIYSNVDARDIHVYHFVGMIDDAINALEVPKSLKKKYTVHINNGNIVM
jgi:transcriptional regulator